MEHREKTIQGLIRNHLTIPETIQRIANIATMDLYFGPYNEDNLEDDEKPIYKGFCNALTEIKAWCDNNIPSELYVDLDCNAVMESEPEGYEDEETGEWIEPFTEFTYHVSKKEILKYLFDKELVNCF